MTACTSNDNRPNHCHDDDNDTSDSVVDPCERTNYYCANTTASDDDHVDRLLDY